MSSQSPSNSSVSTDRTGQEANPAAAFGANEWLVDEIYQQYLQDPNSVDRAWWDFFADYKPGNTGAADKSPEPAATSTAAAGAAVSAAPTATTGAAPTGPAATTTAPAAPARPVAAAPAQAHAPKA
ncbi:2-oxoglutarate dehydrogenase E1 subunit family protein, partial [Streptomyces niveus]|uniref:2-oxoglutarate dehydrogenase E1 subunit family protein n=1 Tax=Streptomyces niveus TaxID=193462 RepID=UPI00364679CE